MLVAIKSQPPDILEVLYAVDPRAFERAKRVKCAMELLLGGMHRFAVCAEIERRFCISKPQAWRVVDMAVDMAG